MCLYKGILLGTLVMYTRPSMFMIGSLVVAERFAELGRCHIAPPFCLHFIKISQALTDGPRGKTYLVRHHSVPVTDKLCLYGVIQYDVIIQQIQSIN